jgi:predicted permease
MSRIAEALHRLRYLATRRRADRELEEEMQLHIEARAEELTRAGLAEAAALTQARREFGSSARAWEESRSAWQFAWIEDLLADARYAARSFRRDPGFAATAVTCLALGIGANALVFSIASEVLFSAPSVRDPLTLAHVRLGGNSHVPLREYRFVRDSGVFTGLGGENEEMEVNWRHGDISERLFSMRVTGNFFQVAGIPVALGRPIALGDTASVAISYRLWQGRFAGDPGVIGRKMILDGAPYTIAGVLPYDHRTVIGFGFSPDLYVPFADERDPRTIVALYGRVREGMSRGELLARLRAVAEDLDRTYPDPHVKWARDLSVAPLAGIDRLRGETEMAIMAAFFAMLMAVVGLVLLIACANVASLLLARAANRSHEFAIRLSIGAGRGRIVRQLLVESLLLALCGAAAGLALNAVGTNLLSRIRLPLPVPIQFAIEPDWLLLVYMIAVSIVCSLAAGLAPALSAARWGLAATLQLDARQTGGRSRLRNALVVAQLAVSVILLAAGFIFLRNLMQASSMSPGFDASRLVWAFMRLVPDAHPQAGRVDALVAAALERLRALPGVESAAITRVVPLNDNMHMSTELTADDASRAERVQFHSNFVSPDYFRTLGIPILAGREFLKSDRNAAILNRDLARELFGDASPVGHTVRFHEGKRLQIVGVAANSKYFTLGEVRPFAMYQPYGDSASRSIENLHFLLRTPLGPQSLVPAIDRTLGSLDSTAAIETKPMSRALVFAMLPSRVGAALLGSIGLLGLALASIGLYGTLAYAVSRRIREIGLRVALGATPGKVLGLVIRQCGALLATGLGIGLVVAALVVRPLTIFLIPEVRPGDPSNFLVVAAVLGLVSLAAAAAPAIRALRIEPTAALRHE